MRRSLLPAGRGRAGGPGRPARAVLTAAAITVALAAPGTPAGAQAAPTTAAAADPSAASAAFPAPLVGVVPEPTDDVAAEYDITDLYRVEGADPGVAELVVQFDGSFTRPAGDYRVAVVVGDPAGERLAAALVSRAGTPEPTGQLLRHDGVAWRDAGTTEVHLDPSGFVMVALPTASLPAGRAVWVEAGQGDPDVPVRRSPYFARAILLGEAPSGVLSGTEVARLDAPTGSTGPSSIELPDVPMATLHQQLLVVGTGGPPPETLAGQPVTKVEDRIRLAPDFNNGATRPAEVRVDWAKGQVSLWDRSSTPQDRSGDREWVDLRYPAEGSIHPDAVEVDLGAVATILEWTIDPTRLAVGVTRVVTLADGRTARAEGVMATAEWFTRTPAAPAPPAEAAAPAEAGAPVAAEPANVLERLRTYDDRVVAGVAAGTALVLLVLLLLARRRRRRKEREAAAVAARDVPPDWDKADGRLTYEAEQRYLAHVLASMPPEDPVDPEALAGAPEGRSRRARRRARKEARRIRKVLDLDALESPDAAASAPPPLPTRAEARAAADQRVAPTDALAALDGDLGELRAKLDELNHH